MQILQHLVHEEKNDLFSATNLIPGSLTPTNILEMDERW
jgi:hypothetical protein